MLKVRVALSNQVSIFFDETDFLCPGCKTFIRYYSVCPLVCKLCNTKLVDVQAMKKIKEVRLAYHFPNIG